MPPTPMAGVLPASLSSTNALGGSMALDLSSTVGVAYGLLESEAPVTWQWELHSLGGEKARFARFNTSLSKAMDKLKPSHLILEKHLPATAISNDNVVNQQRGLRAIASMNTYYTPCAYSECDVHTIRREVMGVRRLSKDAAKKAVVQWCKRHGIQVGSHHAADAALVWVWHRQRMLRIPPCAGPLWEE